MACLVERLALTLSFSHNRPTKMRSAVPISRGLPGVRERALSKACGELVEPLKGMVERVFQRPAQESRIKGRCKGD
jgi:hypothetical protein